MKPSLEFLAAVVLPLLIFGIGLSEFWQMEAKQVANERAAILQLETEAWKIQAIKSKTQLKEIRRFNEQLNATLARMPKRSCRFTDDGFGMQP